MTTTRYTTFGCDIALGQSGATPDSTSVVIVAPTKDLCEKAIYFFAENSAESEFTLPTKVPGEENWMAMGRYKTKQERLQ